MSDLHVSKNIIALGLHKGDMLFFRPESNMYEYSFDINIHDEDGSFLYTHKESISYSFDLLEPFINKGSLLWTERVNLVDEKSEELVNDIKRELGEI